MVRYFRAKIGKAIGMPDGAKRIWYPGSWYENVEKINVRAYDDPGGACIASTEDEDLFQTLKATGHVTELSLAEFEGEVERVRPKPPEVEVRLTGKGKDERTPIEDLLKAKSVTYRIEEA